MVVDEWNITHHGKKDGRVIIFPSFVYARCYKDTGKLVGLPPKSVKGVLSLDDNGDTWSHPSHKSVKVPYLSFFSASLMWTMSMDRVAIEHLQRGSTVIFYIRSGRFDEMRHIYEREAYFAVKYGVRLVIFEINR